MKSSRDDEKIGKEIQSREEQGPSVPSISAITDPDLKRAFLKNYKTLPKQDNSSTGQDIEPTFENEDDLKEQQLSYLFKWYKIKKGYLEIKESITSSTEQLAAIGQLAQIDLKIIEIEPDGNCFFNAIEHQLSLHNQPKKYKDIRTDAVNYLRKAQSQFGDFIDTNEYPTYENYIERMNKNKTYADHLTLTATAIVVKKNIIVHIRGKTPLMIPCPKVPPDNQLHVWYDARREHYDSVVSSDGSRPQVLPLEKLIS
jgi:hypothetical protein